MVGRQIRGATKYAAWWNGLIIRRKYKDFAELRRRWDELIGQGLPAERIGGENQINYIRFRNGASVTLAAIIRLELADYFQGQQFTEISVDEAPTIPFLGQLIDKLKGCLRSPHGVPCRMFLTGNPGGPGAGQIRVMYISVLDGGLCETREGDVQRVVQKLEDGREVITTRVYIRSKLSDNKALMEKDPGYENRLMSIQSPELRKAWLGGRWDVVIGQAFAFTNRHIIPPIWPIPPYVPLYMTMDWGFGAPFSIGWWWVDADDRIYRAAEWYGWNKITANVGLRLTDGEIADGIKEREVELGIRGREITRILGPDCFNKKPDYKGGGQGETTAGEFAKAGLDCIPGDPSRVLKIRQFRNRLAIPKDANELPMMVVYDTCTDFIRTIPSLCSDELTGEYLEEGQELHQFDEACHICMSRPHGPVPISAHRMHEQDRKAQMDGLDSPSRAAAEELEAIIRRIVAEKTGDRASAEYERSVDRSRVGVWS